ncbi:MAG: helicase associated domain-containing protein [Gaiellaceae bacterium]
MEKGQRGREEDTFKQGALKLLKYMMGHEGSTMVPQKYKDDKKLGNWVMNTRMKKRKGDLWIDHIGFLDKCGFVFEPLQSGNSRTK